MALNGDGYAVVVFELAGFVSVQRQVAVQPQHFTSVPDVALTPFDTAATVVELDEPGIKVARGSEQSDADGTRRATLLFPEGVAAAVQGEGGPAPISTLTIRMTEFTVGENGPMAMPADLPPASKYTYALEFSADEAGGAGIEFSQPLPFYVENFVGFPVGEAAPLGYYDHERGLWVALPSGIVLKIISEPGGLAEIDIDGDDVADDVLAALGISDGEREVLASLYEPGESLWRVEIPHFSTMDINWAREALEDLVDQAVRTLEDLIGPENCTDCPGSSIELENQVLGESIGLTGVPAALHYSSSRVRTNNQLFVTVTGPTVPANLIGVTVRVDIAGQVFEESFSAAPDQSWTIEWDGLDGYGRKLSGGHNAVVVIDNLFVERYASTSGFGAIAASAFAIAEGGPIRRAGHINKRFDAIVMAPWGSASTPAGGWSLSQHHLYDPASRTLFLGTGERIEEAQSLGPRKAGRAS